MEINKKRLIYPFLTWFTGAVCIVSADASYAVTTISGSATVSTSGCSGTGGNVRCAAGTTTGGATTGTGTTTTPTTGVGTTATGGTATGTTAGSTTTATGTTTTPTTGSGATATGGTATGTTAGGSTTTAAGTTTTPTTGSGTTATGGTATGTTAGSTATAAGTTTTPTTGSGATAAGGTSTGAATGGSGTGTTTAGSPTAGSSVVINTTGTGSSTGGGVVPNTNQVPIADAGPSRYVITGEPAPLDGTNSTDPDGTDALSFAWRFTQVPVDSALTDAAITDSLTPVSSITPDVDGTYELELVVSDGIDTAAARTTIIAASGTGIPPNAIASAQQEVANLQPVTLDGSASNDPDGGPQPLTYIWSFSQVPSGSMLTDSAIANGTTAIAGFIPDVAGLYILQLDVSDGVNSSQDQTNIVATSGNVAPIADAGVDSVLTIGEIASLDGTNSYDPDSMPQQLSYNWHFVSLPSTSALGNTDLFASLPGVASFTPDVPGSYLLRLDVSDGDRGAFDQMLVAVNALPGSTPVAAASSGGLATTGTDPNTATVDTATVVSDHDGSDALGDMERDHDGVDDRDGNNDHHHEHDGQRGDETGKHHDGHRRDYDRQRTGHDHD